ncbi:MAG: hypothetical protein WC714_19640 [Candidatus Obscuribacterales bacterium]
MTHKTETAENTSNIVLFHGRGQADDNARKVRLARRLATAGQRQVVEARLIGSGGDRLMLMLADSLGHYTQCVDLADFSAWLSSNHPDIYNGKGASVAAGILAVDFHALPPQVLDGALSHCRAQRAAKASKVIVGHLLPPESPFMLYYSEAGWGTSAGGAFW